MNVPFPTPTEFELRERVRRSEGRLRPAEALAAAARRLLAEETAEARLALLAALDCYERPPLPGAPGRPPPEGRSRPTAAAQALGSRTPARRRGQRSAARPPTRRTLA